MNPFVVQKIINESNRNGQRLIIEQLSEKCGVKLRHAHVIMSEDMFESEVCKGFMRHWVKAVSPFGWITLWTYKNPEREVSPFIPEGEKLMSFSELKSITDVETKHETDFTNEA